jgi:glycosyltransferase involved in cell wall biosynthesis
MSTAIQSIIKAAFPKNGPLNIVLVNPNENYSRYLSYTGHNFYFLGREWNHIKCPIPTNVCEAKVLQQNMELDLVVCFGRQRGFYESTQIAKNYHIPLILFERDLPSPNQKKEKVSGDVNVFISKYQAQEWGFDKEYYAVNNCVDPYLFTSGNKMPEVLTAINRWRQRDWSHGFRYYHSKIDKKIIPVKIIEEMVHWQDLAEIYSHSKIYFNPISRVPQPTQILEAMASGCIVISVDSVYNREIIKNNFNGFLINTTNPAQVINYILKDKSLTHNQICYNAASTVYENFSVNDFVKNWNKIFKIASGKAYTGENYES